VSDPAHVVPGDRGPFVAKIQSALNILDETNLQVDGDYGPRTADAVLAYKQHRNIINRNYQQTADNIVGRMTIAALDAELMALTRLKPLTVTDLGGKPSLFRSPKQQHIQRLTSTAGGRGA
jgi:peptidoglycan hydrolase-like protein with peptidoglycan-binding domain